MTKKINRLTHTAKRYSRRTVAIVLSLVMLMSAIVSGSMLNTFAAYMSDNAPADGGTVSQAATEGSDIALNAIPSDEDSADDEDAKEAPDLSGFEENGIVKDLKKDLAVTGANADIASTGDRYTYVNLYFGTSSSPAWKAGTTPSGDAYTFTESCTAGTTYYFYYALSESGSGTKYMGYGGAIPVDTQYNMGKYSSIGSNICRFTAGETTTYTFTAKFNENDGTIKITGGSGGGTSTETWTVAGSSTAILGSSWSQTDTNNDMIFVSGNTYTLVKTNVGTPANFEFKICKDHAWSTAYPSSNFSITYSSNSSTTRTVSATGSSMYWKSGDTITFTFNNSTHAITVTSETPETTHDVTFSAGTGGTISPTAGTHAVGEVTATTVTATANTGYKFSSWTNGTGITQVTNTASGDNQTQTITTKSSGNYTVQANFTKKNYTVTYTPTTMATDHGTYTVTKTTDSTAVASGTSLPYQTGLTVTCTPDTGYTVDYVKVNNSDSGVTLEGNTAVFTVPAANAAITVAFKRVALSMSKSTSPAGKGTVNVTCGGSTYANLYYIGDNLSLSTTVSDNAYTVSSYTLIYGDGTRATIEGSTGTTGAIDATHFGTDGSISIIANLTKKPTYKITVKTSSPILGTASANVAEAYEGQTVTLTATENSGTFKKWTVDSGTASGVNNDTNKTKSFTMGSGAVTIKANFDEYSGTSNWYYNGYNTSNNDGAWRSTGSNDGYAMQMTEAKVDGKLYSYYKVTTRTGSNQLFTVSNKSPAFSSGEWDYIYFHGGKDGSTDTNWYKDNDIGCWFESSDGKTIKTYAIMEFAGWSDGYKMWRAHVPYGAKYVNFKDDHKTCTWEDIDLSSGYRTNMCYWTNSSGSNGSYNIAGYSNPVPDNFHEYFYNMSSVYTNTTGHSFGNYNVTFGGATHNLTNPSNASTSNYYILVLYPGNTYTVNGDTVTVSSGSVPKIVYTDKLPSAIIADDTPTVDIYAKNGTLRDSTFNRFTNLANTDFVDYFEYTEMLDSGAYTYTSIDEYNESGLHTAIDVSNNVSGYNSTYATMTNVPVGAKIKLKTTLSSTASDAGSFDGKAFKTTHYLKAYSFNGATYELHEPNDDGVYEEVWTVRDVNTKSGSGASVTNLMKDGKAIEVTPIYYMKDNSNCKTFYIDGYDGEVQGKWGNMLSVYPYYEGKSNSANAFGGYPGQPMLYWGGKYQMEIPLTVDGTSTGATVKGLTLHNGFWDMLHRSLDNVCDKHAQTYDYDDFYKLYKEKNPDTIIFDFKYRTTKDNYNDGYDYYNYTFADDTTGAASTYAGSGYNGVELITDYFGRQVDAFGTLIPDADQSDYDATHPQDKELLFVSTGYKDTYVGEYATLWAVYAPQSSIPSGSGDTAGKFIGYISSSMLYLKNLDRVSQYTDGTNTGNGKMSWSQNINTYTHLKDYYTGVPALISYEEEIYNDSKDKANRSDGKWYYSNKNDQITANIQVQYCDDDTQVVTKQDKALNDDVWTTDTFATSGDSYKGLGGEYNIGPNSGCSAYFTNTSPYLKGKTDSGKQFADSTKKFTFEAVPSGQYMFVNWVRYSNGKYYEVSEKEVAESPMSSNDTYIARFVKTRSGSLKISHVVESNSTYTGSGTPSVTVTVTNGSTVVYTETRDDGTPIDISRFMNTKYAAYKIDISLSTAPDEDSTLNDITNGSGISKYNPGAISNNAATVTQFTINDALEVTGTAVSTLRYVSHLSTINYTYNYNIRYTYTSRFWGEQYYDVTGTLHSNNAEEMMNITGKKGSAQLTEGFIENKTPYEKNFRQKIYWNYTYESVTDEGGNIIASAMTNSASAGSEANTYNINVTVDSSNVVNDKVTADILLPYPHDTISNDYAAQTVVAHKSVAEDSITYNEYIYDEAQEAVPVTAQAYKLFTTDGSVPDSGDNFKPSEIPHLVQAAPYVWKNPAKRYEKEEVVRYFTGTYFTVKGTKYWYNAVPEGETGVAVTESTTCTWKGKTYTWAVLDDSNSDVDKQEVYSFKENGANGQYTRHTWEDTLSGFYMYDSSGNPTGTKTYFTRWDIYSAYDGSYVASSYNRYFNYSGYENYRVKAVYESDALNPAAESDIHNVPTITYLGDTRNQWTAGGQGSADDVYNNASNGGDKLLHDFAISFDYYEDEIRLIDNAANGGRDIKIGMLIEQIGTLDSSGGDKILDPAYYGNKYKGTYDADAIKDYFEGNKTGAQLKTTLGASAIVNSKIGANVANWGTLFTSHSGNIGNGNDGIQPIDNMNRLQWYYTFTNTVNNRNAVYRASAYIIDNGVATVSSVPVYFTLYDSASR